MARPTKQGIDYFPVDVQFNDQLELLIADKGAEALAVIITIWQLIYQNNGYYIENGHDLTLLIKRRIIIEPVVTSEIIIAAIDRGIFDKELYKKHNILTSNGIQKRYISATRLKKNINLVENYLLVDVSNVGNYTYVGVNAVVNATKEEVDVDADKKKRNICIFSQDDFDKFWKIYPKEKHTGKKETIVRWKTLMKSKELPALEIILGAIKSQITWRERTDSEEFIPPWKNPATWLNKGCWEDEVPEKEESSWSRRVRESKEEEGN